MCIMRFTQVPSFLDGQFVFGILDAWFQVD